MKETCPGNCWTTSKGSYIQKRRKENPRSGHWPRETTSRFSHDNSFDIFLWVPLSSDFPNFCYICHKSQPFFSTFDFSFGQNFMSYLFLKNSSKIFFFVKSFSSLFDFLKIKKKLVQVVGRILERKAFLPGAPRILKIWPEDQWFS